MSTENENQPVEQNGQNIPPNPPQEKKKPNIMMIALIVVVLVLAGVVYHFATQKADDDFAIDPNVILNAEDAKAAVEEAKVPATSINVSMLRKVFFEDGQSSGIIDLENTERNIYPYKITISLASEEGDVLLYESGLIPVGAKLEEITLLQDLDAGEYPAVVMFTNYNENNEAVGRVGVAIDLVVKN